MSFKCPLTLPSFLQRLLECLPQVQEEGYQKCHLDSPFQLPLAHYQDSPDNDVNIFNEDY